VSSQLERPGDSDGAAAGAVLLEAARQRLLLVAADVLGRLPADDVPQSLRRVARFAPAKRPRLGAAALAAALDADEDFRDRVAEVVAEASPQLVDALRAGAATPASDPLDIAVVAYLIRPDGWQETVASANARWRDEGGASDVATADESAKLRTEIQELRARVKAEAARVRDEVTAATSDIEAQLADLRRKLRARTGELRAAERARDEAVAALAAAQNEATAEAAAREAELRRVRNRIAELERAGESARRDSRADRDLDDARLGLLVDTLADAAAGIRRELSLAPSRVRPGDTVASVEGAPPARRADDPIAVERLLALPNVHVIVDGYNVTKTGYGELPLADQRARLVASMSAVVARSRAEVTVAFDGGAKPPAQPPTPRGVRVLFSAADEIADDLIRRLVAAEPQGRPVVVVTSDQQVVTDVLAAGAWAVPSAVFLARIG
jgi:predicted RNA-binding protein with PIN domain